MSRGLGDLQRRILETLAAYRRLGSALQWETPASRDLWNDGERALYENGCLVEMWKLRRDTDADKTALARALRTLARRGLVERLHGPTLFTEEDRGRRPMKCSYAGITAAGLAEVAERQQSDNVDVDAYEPMPGEWLPQ